MIIFAATQGYCDAVAVSDVSRYQGELRNFLNQQHPEIGADIVSSQDLIRETPRPSCARPSVVFRDTWVADKGES